MSKIETKTQGPLIREIRLGSITGFAGTPGELVDQSHQGTLKDRHRTFTQCSMCSSFCSTLQLSLIQDAIVINHAPLGCTGDTVCFNLYNLYGRAKRNMPPVNLRLFNTNLQESDMVFGAAEKLKSTIREAFNRFSPKAIFVTTSCASAIIGEDIDALTQNLSSDLNIPIIPVYCEGFRSQVWASGWDSAYHAVLTGIVKPPKVKQPELINVITFIGTDFFTPLFKKLGLTPNYIVPFSTIEQLEHISESAATVQMCSTLGTYLASELEKRYGVPEVKSPPPYGFDGTDRWFRELAKIVKKEAQVESLIAEEKQAIAAELAELRKKFQGLKAFVATGPSLGNSHMSVLFDLGFSIAGSCFFHHDPKFDHGDPRGDGLSTLVHKLGKFKMGVCNKQAYEVTNQLLKIKPDVFVTRHPGLSVTGAKLGIPTVFIDDEHLYMGYRGVVQYGRKIADWIRNPAIEKNLARHRRTPYTPWWLEQEPFTFLEQ
jgi:nitrogenase molybdenum-iron protein alpha chain